MIGIDVVKPQRKTRLTAIVWLLTFVGQAVAASAVHCNMQLMAAMNAGTIDHSQMNHAQMDHSGMNHSNMNHAGAGQDITTEEQVEIEQNSPMIPECCQLGADCSEGNCSYIYLAITAAQFEFQPITTALPDLNNLATSKFQSSLYRPPIFA